MKINSRTYTVIRDIRVVIWSLRSHENSLNAAVKAYQAGKNIAIKALGKQTSQSIILYQKTCKHNGASPNKSLKLQNKVINYLCGPTS